MNERKRIHAALFLVALLGILSAAQSSRAQSGPCDPGIVRLSGSGSLAYKDLGARCEGTFANPSGGAADLQLVSLTKSFPLMNFDGTSPLSLIWFPPFPADVRLRAVSTRYKFYYQMDAHPGTANKFTWPTDRLAASGLLRPEVGVLAWFPHAIAGKTLDLFLPVVVKAKGSPPPRSSSIEVVVVPTVQLKEVFRSVTHYTDEGVKQTVALSNSPLQYGSYPAHEPVRLSLDLGTTDGLYRFDVTATIADGGTLQRSYWIYVGRAH
jgi:hypothetical protein